MYFLYLSYYGTFKQWKEFLTMKDMLPKAFSTISLSVNYGKEARYTSKRISFSYGSDVMAITEKSDMSLLFSYLPEGKKTVWDVTGVVVGESRNTNTNFNIYREMRPSKKLSDSYQSAWENIVKQKFPYNNSAYYREGGTIISTVMPDPVSSGAKAAHAPFYYTVSFVRDGKAEQKDTV